MTATATVEPAAPAAPAASAAPAVAADARPRSLLPLAELALTSVTIAVVFGFNRLFVDATYLPPLFWFAVGSHTVAAVCRRRGLGLLVTALISTVAFAFVVGWVLYQDTTSNGIPVGATLDAARTDLSLVWEQFRLVVAPAEVQPSFLLAAAIAIWVTGYIADWAAFRLWVPFEAVVPAGTVFVFSSLFGAPAHRTVATFAFLATLFAFLLCHRVARQQSSASWLTSDISRGSRSLLRTGGTLAAVAVVAGIAGGPLLPGADAEAVVPWRDLNDESGSRQTVSPLVEIRGRLVDQSNNEMFTVRTSRRAYWRLTSLGVFDGSIWSSKGSYGQENGDLKDAEQFDAEAEAVHQEYTIADLAAIWLPAAFEAEAIAIDDVDVRWEAKSATLIVDTEFDDSDGFTYEIDSLSPRFEPSELTADVGEGIPGSIRDDYLDLPDSFSDQVAFLARDVTSSADTAYGKALTLQNWFRENFTYSLDVPGGHSGDALENFLFNTRTGYCEQFAGSFAAMARSLGLPARVAVGFTPGDEDPEEPGLYHVLGKHGHAWPEVYIGSVGWVSFEPTPGRGQPGAEGYTGVPEQQVDSNDVSSATTVPGTVGDPVNTPSSAPGEGGATTTAPEAPDTGELPGAGVSTESRPGWLSRTWRAWRGELFVALAVLFGAALLYAVGLPLAGALRRRRRRQRAESPGDRVGVAWEESVEAMSVLGVTPRRSETFAEFAGRAGRQVDGSTYPALATCAESASYSSDGVTDDDAERAFELSEHIQRSVQEQATREQRVKALLDPRPLLPQGRGGERRQVERV